MVPLYIFTLILGANAILELTTPDHKLTFNPQLFEDVLDEELCHEQMQYLINNNTALLLRCEYPLKIRLVKKLLIL